MRRFETPAAPPGWAGQGAELLRIVDPTGRAIAWLAPGFGANCVGYAVRQDDPAPGGWRHILHSGSPRELRADPQSSGCAVLGPELTGRGTAHLARWRFVERDPTAATCSVRCGSVWLDLTAQLADAALHLELLATNEGEAAIPIALGLRLSLAGEFRRDTASLLSDQPATFVGDDPAARITVAANAGMQCRWEVEQSPGETIVVEAWDTNTSDTRVPPGSRVRFALAIAAQ